MQKNFLIQCQNFHTLNLLEEDTYQAYIVWLLPGLRVHSFSLFNALATINFLNFEKFENFEKIWKPAGNSCVVFIYLYIIYLSIYLWTPGFFAHFHLPVWSQATAQPYGLRCRAFGPPGRLKQIFRLSTQISSESQKGHIFPRLLSQKFGLFRNCWFFISDPRNLPWK